MEVKADLEKSENMLKKFREKSRRVSDLPHLLLEQGRLMRNVEILQTVFVELNEKLELAKIDEIKDTPILNIKEVAKEPIKKAVPKRMNTLIIILFLSDILSMIYALQKKTK